MSGVCNICNSSLSETTSFDPRIEPLRLAPCPTCLEIINEAAKLPRENDEYDDVPNVDEDWDQMELDYEYSLEYGNRFSPFEYD